MHRKRHVPIVLHIYDSRMVKIHSSSPDLLGAPAKLLCSLKMFKGFHISFSISNNMDSQMGMTQIVELGKFCTCFAFFDCAWLSLREATPTSIIYITS